MTELRELDQDANPPRREISHGVSRVQLSRIRIAREALDTKTESDSYPIPARIVQGLRTAAFFALSFLPFDFGAMVYSTTPTSSTSFL